MVIFHNYVSLPEGSPIDSDWRLNVYEKHADFMGIFLCWKFFQAKCRGATIEVGVPVQLWIQEFSHSEFFINLAISDQWSD